jgi:TPR repeat protein
MLNELARLGKHAAGDPCRVKHDIQEANFQLFDVGEGGQFIYWQRLQTNRVIRQLPQWIIISVIWPRTFGLKYGFLLAIGQISIQIFTVSMATTGKIPTILSLSAATMALFEIAQSSKGQSINASTSKTDEAFNSQMTSQTDHVVLEPPHQKELLRLYAGHSSHSSHSSHVSGMGGDSYPVQAPVPAYIPAQRQPVYQTTPVPVKPASIQTNTPIVSIAETNNTASVTTKLNYLESLKKEAANGSADAQYALALYYIHGEGGCEKNIEKAKMLLELSTIQGNSDAKNRLEKLLADEKNQATK